MVPEFVRANHQVTAVDADNRDPIHQVRLAGAAKQYATGL